jgi:PmbA protein
VVALKQEKLLSTAEDVVKSALKKGAAEAEAYVVESCSTMVGIERGQIAKSSRVLDQGLGVRAVANKTVGFSYTNMLGDKKALEEAVAKAVSAARASKPDKDWPGFPVKRSFPSVKGGFDKRIVELGSDDLVEIAGLILDSAEATDKRVIPVEGGVSASYGYGVVANSNGVAGFDSGTVIDCGLATVGNDAGEVTPVCYELNTERSYDIDPEWVGREAARLAASSLKAKKVETKCMTVIFVQTALQELLGFTLINAVKADYVQRNQSALKGKIGERVASELVSVYDDGLLEGGLRTGKFDGEGVPHQRTPIIEKGVLRGFIYDNYTAEKEGKESTGNAARGGYWSTPSLEANNFHVVSGSKSNDALVGEVNEGLIVYLLQGAHSSNPASGDFSVVGAPAWKIEKGEIAYAVKGAMVSGNVFELLRNISGLSDMERQVGALVSPWVRVENVKVIGK